MDKFDPTQFGAVEDTGTNTGFDPASFGAVEETPVETPEKSQAGRTYMQQAGDLVMKHIINPQVQSFENTVDLINGMLPAVKNIRNAGTELAIGLYSDKLQQEATDSTEQTIQNIYKKYINNPEASIEQREKGLALLQTLTTPDITAAMTGYSKNDLKSKLQRYTNAGIEDMVDAFMWGYNPALKSTAGMKFLPAVKQTAKEATKLGTVYGGSQFVKSMAGNITEGQEEGKNLEDVLKQSGKEALTTGGITAAVTAAIPMAQAIYKMFPSISNKFFTKTDKVDDLFNSLDDVKQQVEDYTQTISGTKTEAGISSIDSATLRFNNAQEKLKNTTKAVTNMAADSIAPKVDDVYTASTKIDDSINKIVTNQKDKVNKLFYETPEIYTTRTVPDNYYAKLGEIQTKFGNVEGWESLVNQTKKWLIKNTDESAQMVDDIFAAGGQDLIDVMKAQGKIPEATMADKSLKDLIYTKEAIDDMIKYNNVQGLLLLINHLLKFLNL